MLIKPDRHSKYTGYAYLTGYIGQSKLEFLVVMITKTKKNELVWLENGNQRSGLKHILNRHERDLKNKFGVSKEIIPRLIKDIFTKGVERSSKYKNGGYEKKYEYNGNYFVITGVGTNGYIITIYPDPKGGK